VVYAQKTVSPRRLGLDTIKDRFFRIYLRKSNVATGRLIYL